MKICAIVNPAAGRGRALRALPALRRIFAARNITDLRVTTPVTDEQRITNDALDAGVECIIAVGGDGTCSKIANAILARASSCRLAVIPLGTGNDFAKTLGTISLSPTRVADLCASQSIARMDVGTIGERFFVNGCGFGLAPAVLESTLGATRIGGSAVYLLNALRKLFDYGGIDVAIPPDNGGQGAGFSKKMMLTVSNGPSLGGVFRIAPISSVCDGLLDVHVFSPAPPARRLLILASALRGTHAKRPEVKFEQRRAVHLSFRSRPLVEVDGELYMPPGDRVTIECLPGALSVVAAPGFPR